MAFGSLASLKPSSTGTNYSLYVAPESTLVEGKVYVVNQNQFPIRFNVGLSTSELSSFDYSGFVAYKKEISPGESFESETIYFADGESLIVNSESQDVTFTLLGKESNHTFGGFSGSKNSTKTTPEILYSAGITGNEQVGNIFACNRNPFPVKVRLSVGVSSNYIDYEHVINPFETFEKTDVRIYDSQIIYCKTSDVNTNFVFTSKPESSSLSSSSVSVGGTWAVNGAGIHTSKNVGIGTELSSSALWVEGDGYFSGIVTATRFESTSSTGTPTIDSPNNLNINAVTVAISTDLTVGGDAYVGVDTSSGLILTSPNGTTYRLIVDNSGNLTTISVP